MHAVELFPVERLLVMWTAGLAGLGVSIAVLIGGQQLWRRVTRSRHVRDMERRIRRAVGGRGQRRVREGR